MVRRDPVLSAQDRAEIIARAKKKALKDADSREHLRYEIDCRTLIRELSSIESVLHRGAELRKLSDLEWASLSTELQHEALSKNGCLEIPLSRERIASLRAAGDLKFKRLSLALPPLKPALRQSRSIDLGDLTTNEGRMQALILVSYASARGDISHEEAEVHFQRIKQIHDTSRSDELDGLLERLDQLEEQVGGRTIEAERAEPPEAVSDQEFNSSLPQWGTAPQRLLTEYQDITLIED